MTRLIPIASHSIARAVCSLAVWVALGLVAIPAPAAEDPRRFRFGEGLTLVYDPRDEALAERIWPVLVEDRREVMDRLGQHPEGTLRVLLAPTREEFAEALGGFMPDALGLYFPATRTVVLRSPRTLTGGNWEPRGVMRHELAHGVLDLAIGGRLPRWLNEGLAILIAGETSFLDESRLSFLAFRERLIPLRLLIGNFPAGHGLDLAYLEAASFARYLMRRAGPEGIRRVVERLAAGDDAERALLVTYGETLDRLEQGWRDELSGRFSWWALATPITVFGGLGAPLVVMAYLRRTLQARRRLREWEQEGEIGERTGPDGGDAAPRAPLRPSASSSPIRLWRSGR